MSANRRFNEGQRWYNDRHWLHEQQQTKTHADLLEAAQRGGTRKGKKKSRTNHKQMRKYRRVGCVAYFVPTTTTTTHLFL